MTQAGSRKTIFITGAGSGIGRATAQLFAERGWFVGLYDINPEGLRQTQALLPADRQTSGVFDVRDREAWSRAVSQFSDQTGGKMHVLFNNAGIAQPGWIEDIEPAKADAIVDVNFKGVINGVVAALPLLKATPGARIVNTASASALYGTPRLAIYSATKFAVRGLTEALDIEFKRHNIRVTSLMPWFIDTPILEEHAAKSNENMRGQLAQQTEIYPVATAAQAAWDAAHGKAVHYYAGKNAARLNFAARFLPGLVRQQVARSMDA